MATRPDIKPLDSDSVEFWRVLLYADSGTGKTVFAGSDTKLLFIATEADGLMSAQRINKHPVERVLCKTWEDLVNVYEWFDEHPEECSKYNVLSIDSITEMQRLAREYVIRITRAEKIRKNQDPDKMQIQDYGLQHDLVENIVRGFNDLPVNILWTATAKKVEDADKNPFLVPDLQGKGDYGVAMKMVALMTSYGYMRVENIKIPAPTEQDSNATKTVKRRVIYWEDTGTIRGKDRSVALAPFTVNMNLQQMRLAIAGKMVRDNEGRIVKVQKPSAEPKPATAPKVKTVQPQASPKPDDRVTLGENPANTLDTAHDITDSVPQAPKGDGAELDAVKA